jgi:paraquat-inducible protein A
MRLVIPLILFLATLCFALGIVQPLIRVERLFVFADEPSLVGIVSGLWNEGDAGLAIIVAAFSLVFPAIKLALLHIAAYGGREASGTIPRWFRALSNWSMLDVVLVALVIFAAKTSGVATAFTKPGLWFFAASVVLTAAASSLLKSRGALVDHG